MKRTDLQRKKRENLGTTIEYDLLDVEVSLEIHRIGDVYKNLLPAVCYRIVDWIRWGILTRETRAVFVTVNILSRIWASAVSRSLRLRDVTRVCRKNSSRGIETSN